MLQVKLVQGKDMETLENNVNRFLASLSSDVKDIKVDGATAFVLYELEELWKDRMCCECQYWDDGGETGVTGICHECGQRRRFNYKACECFKDIRGCK